MIRVNQRRADGGERDAVVFTFELPGKTIVGMRRYLDMDTFTRLVEGSINTLVDAATAAQRVERETV
jgi:hypothetical protein